MSLAGSAPDEAMSSTGEPTILPSAAGSSGGALRDAAGFAGRGSDVVCASARGGAAATTLAGIGAGGGAGGAGGAAGFAAIRPSSVRRASGGTPLVARLSDAPQVTQKR